MATGLPVDYVEQYIYQYVGYVKKKHNGKLNGGCPICHEGDSWGRKSRFYYDPEREYIGRTMICHNCGYSSNSVNFISDVTGMEYRDIMQESTEYDIIPVDITANTYERTSTTTNTLPSNCINLCDPLQVLYYNDNDVVKLAIEYINTRKLFDAPNKPKAFYISLDDYCHKNRLIIPYYDKGKIVWYQTRKLLDDDSPKYLSKSDSDRSIFNIDCIDGNIPYIFIFEGAIDSMFVKNGTCLSGITESGDFLLTKTQQKQFLRFPFHKKVWVIDSPYHDEAAKNKTKLLFDNGELVFKWPEKLGKACKDFNDIIMASSKTEIPHEFIMGNLMKENNVLDQVKLNLIR